MIETHTTTSKKIQCILSNKHNFMIKKMTRMIETRAILASNCTNQSEKRERKNKETKMSRERWKTKGGRKK